MKGTINPISKPMDEMPIPEEQTTQVVVPSGEQSAIERQIAHFRSGFSKEVNMKTVISPISGVEFDNLIEGQEILFRVPTETQEGMSDASLLGLIDEEGKVSKEPLIGKF